MMNFYGEQDMVRSSDEFENGCINALHRADGDLSSNVSDVSIHV